MFLLIRPFNMQMKSSGVEGFGSSEYSDSSPDARDSAVNKLL